MKKLTPNGSVVLMILILSLYVSYQIMASIIEGWGLFRIVLIVTLGTLLIFYFVYYWRQRRTSR